MMTTVYGTTVTEVPSYSKGLTEKGKATSRPAELPEKDTTMLEQTTKTYEGQGLTTVYDQTTTELDRWTSGGESIKTKDKTTTQYRNDTDWPKTTKLGEGRDILQFRFAWNWF